MVQITSNELVHPDQIRRAVSGQDENGPTLALSLSDGGVRNLAGEDAVSCWNELQARRVQFPFAVPSLPAGYPSLRFTAPAAAAPSRKRKTAAAADAAPPAPAEDAAPPAPAEDAAPAAEQ